MLVKIGDPLFLGFILCRDLLGGAKYINKRKWDEKVGVHVVVDGKLEVVEYSELSEEEA